MKHVLYGKCVKCGKTYPAVPDLTNCDCGGILDIVYDYDYIRTRLTKETLADRRTVPCGATGSCCRWRRTTPTPPCGWAGPPCTRSPAWRQQLGLKRLWVKDDGQNPTASLKDRATAMAVAKAREAGAEVIACSSTGNAASSLAGNAAAAGFRPTSSSPPGRPRARWPS